MILLTGACGFIGSNISKRLDTLGYEVINVDDLSFGSADNIGVRKLHKIGFETLSSHLLNKCDILIHCATINIIFAMDYPVKTFKTNALNTFNLFKKFKGKIIYTSTASVYGMADSFPTLETAEKRVSNAYDQSKLLAEMFLKQRGDYTTLRLSNVYGINQRPGKYCGVIGKLVNQSLSNHPMDIIGDGSQTRDYTYIDDVVNAVIAAIDQKSKNEEINIATGIETSTKSLSQIIAKHSNKIISLNYTPLREIDSITRRCLDIEKAKLLLGWQPKYTINEGIEKTIKWMSCTR